MKNLKILTAFFCAAAFACQSARAQFASENTAVNSDFSTIENAVRALDMGMPAVSQILAQKALNSGTLKNVDLARTILVDSLIEQGGFDSALVELDNFKNKDGDEFLLRNAVALVGSEDSEKIAQLLAKISPQNLSQRTKPWFYITRGRLNFDAGKFNEALDDFNNAEKLSQSDSAKNQAQILANLCKLSQDLNVADLNALAAQLELKTSLFMGVETGAQFAKQYAIVLDRLGKKAEALQVVSDTLDIALISDSDRDELAMISAKIEPSAERKRAMLVELLKKTHSPIITEQAIYLLRGAFGDSKTEYSAELDDILKNGSPLVRDRILLELSYDALRRNNLSAVVSNAEALLRDYPASKFVPNAYGVLAWAAFSDIGGKKPDYRLAAQYLNSLAALQKNASDADFTKMSAADCYFLDSDFETAAAMYKELVGAKLENRWRGGVFGRAVESMLNLGDIKGAVNLADDTYKKFTINPDDIWRAEWAIANAYKRAGNLKSAQERVDSLLSNSALKKSDSALLARMFWLQTRLAEDSGDWAKTLSLSEKLLESIRRGEFKASKEAVDEISSSVMLIKARTLAYMGKFDTPQGAFEAYEQLRKAYPKSDAAQISYLYEARLFAARGAYAQAQQHCKKLADLFPQGAYADSALFDAATYSRKLGLESDYKEALSLLSKIGEKYPNSPKVFFAKIAQAEILRLMGDFANAAAIYRNAISEFEAHPQARIAMMGLGDCYLAQSGKESDAASTFEKLYYLPNMPLDAKAETAFKWGFALERSGRLREASEVWWISANSFLKDFASKTAAKNLDKSAYWVARSLLELAKSLEQAGDKTSAAAAYTLLVEYNLPGAGLAKSKLLTQSKK